MTYKSLPEYGLYATATVCRLLPITRRRLAHYVQMGLIQLRKQRPGSGNSYMFSPLNVLEAAVLDEIQDLGVIAARIKPGVPAICSALREFATAPKSYRAIVGSMLLIKMTDEGYEAWITAALRPRSTGIYLNLEKTAIRVADILKKHNAKQKY